LKATISSVVFNFRESDLEPVLEKDRLFFCNRRFGSHAFTLGKNLVFSF